MTEPDPKRHKRVYARPQKESTKAKTRYYCCACGYHGRRKYKCGFCASEDVFDKTEASWPCGICKEPQALFESICVECQRKKANAVIPALLVSLFDQLFGIDIRDGGLPEDLEENPEEDFGSAAHRSFRGRFPKGTRMFGDPQ